MNKITVVELKYDQNIHQRLVNLQLQEDLRLK